jgi:hypothetical protein
MLCLLRLLSLLWLLRLLSLLWLLRLLCWPRWQRQGR